ncbi:hypothetical protein B0H10DRAFT_2219894 [Mycena sp. CBHHK59/15]|nr:hypothetical protein B0H10DRAFT_2219894 [Mycena sp. CBHHK59/15]
MDVVLGVDGKVKRKSKPEYTNTDLPFPKNSFPADLKFWQSTIIPEFLDWIATHDDAFATNAHPEFNEVEKNLWEMHYGAHQISDAVYAMAAAAVRNWRRKIGKTTLKVVELIITGDDYPTLESHHNYVHDKLLNSAFVYENEVDETDVSYGHPAGVMAITCAATERPLHMYKTSTCSADGVKRKGKRSAHSFVTIPWATRAKAYLPGIKTLTTHKWSKILAMSSLYIESTTQIAADDMEGDESEDSRGLIHISDESDEEA